MLYIPSFVLYSPIKSKPERPQAPHTQPQYKQKPRPVLTRALSLFPVSLCGPRYAIKFPGSVSNKPLFFSVS